MSLSLNNIVSSFFLLILIMFSNFLYELFPRQLYHLFTNNLLIKHLLVVFLIYFSIELIDNVNTSPFVNFYNSLIVYVFYIFFIKSTLSFSLIIIILLVVNFILLKQREYLKKNNQEYKQLDKPIEIITYVILGILGISFLYYLAKQIMEQKNFSFYKFIVGDMIELKNNENDLLIRIK